MVAGRRRAERPRVRFGKGRNKTPGPAEKRAFRARILKEREIDTVGEALLLRGRRPEESIEIMFDMMESVEDLAKAVKRA